MPHIVPHRDHHLTTEERLEILLKELEDAIDSANRRIENGTFRRINEQGPHDG